MGNYYLLYVFSFQLYTHVDFYTHMVSTVESFGRFFSSLSYCGHVELDNLFTPNGVYILYSSLNVLEISENITDVVS